MEFSGNRGLPPFLLVTHDSESFRVVLSREILASEFHSDIERYADDALDAAAIEFGDSRLFNALHRKQAMACILDALQLSDDDRTAMLWRRLLQSSSARVADLDHAVSVGVRHVALFSEELYLLANEEVEVPLILCRALVSRLVHPAVHALGLRRSTSIADLLKLLCSDRAELRCAGMLLLALLCMAHSDVMVGFPCPDSSVFISRSSTLDAPIDLYAATAGLKHYFSPLGCDANIEHVLAQSTLVFSAVSTALQTPISESESLFNSGLIWFGSLFWLAMLHNSNAVLLMTDFHVGTSMLHDSLDQLASLVAKSDRLRVLDEQFPIASNQNILFDCAVRMNWLIISLRLHREFGTECVGIRAACSQLSSFSSVVELFDCRNPVASSSLMALSSTVQEIFNDSADSGRVKLLQLMYSDSHVMSAVILSLSLPPLCCSPTVLWAAFSKAPKPPAHAVATAIVQPSRGLMSPRLTRIRHLSVDAAVSAELPPGADVLLAVLSQAISIYISDSTSDIKQSIHSQLPHLIRELSELERCTQSSSVLNLEIGNVAHFWQSQVNTECKQ